MRADHGEMRQSGARGSLSRLSRILPTVSLCDSNSAKRDWKMALVNTPGEMLQQADSLLFEKRINEAIDLLNVISK